MLQYCSGRCAPIHFLPCPETVLTDAIANVHATVLHTGLYIFLGFAYQKFPMHGDCAAALLCLSLLSETTKRLATAVSWPRRVSKIRY